MKLVLKALITLLASVSLYSSAFAAPADFAGTWVNTNRASRGVIRVVVYPNMQLQAYGACTPTPCDWGRVPMITYGRSISDPNHNAGSAHYDFSFKKTDIVVKLLNKTAFTLENYNRFTDNSGRQNYWASESFRRATTAELAEDFQSAPSEPQQ